MVPSFGILYRIKCLRSFELQLCTRGRLLFLGRCEVFHVYLLERDCFLVNCYLKRIICYCAASFWFSVPSYFIVKLNYLCIVGQGSRVRPTSTFQSLLSICVSDCVVEHQLLSLHLFDLRRLYSLGSLEGVVLK